MFMSTPHIIKQGDARTLIVMGIVADLRSVASIAQHHTATYAGVPVPFDRNRSGARIATVVGQQQQQEQPEKAWRGMLLLMSVSEPERQDGHRQPASLSEAFAYLSRHRALFGLQLVGYALIALAAYGVGAWIPTVFIRSYGWTAAQAGINYGLSLTVLGTLAASLRGPSPTVGSLLARPMPAST